MARIEYGQTTPDLFDRVQLIVWHLKILTPFVNDQPGEKWYRLFLLCFPDLVSWQAQLLSKLRAGVSHKAINKWFDEIREYLFETANLDILEQPNKIYNCDRTGFPMVPWPMKVIASKGDPHIYQQGASTKAQMTVLLMASATAHYMAPLIVFLGTTFVEEFYNTSFLMLFSDTLWADGWTRTYFSIGWNKVLHPRSRNVTSQNPCCF